MYCYFTFKTKTPNALNRFEIILLVFAQKNQIIIPKGKRII